VPPLLPPPKRLKPQPDILATCLRSSSLAG
jgi:hypothetical protein